MARAEARCELSRPSFSAKKASGNALKAATWTPVMPLARRKP